MILSVIELITGLAGTVTGMFIPARRVRYLPEAPAADAASPAVSVIIPARNEAGNLPQLLTDLKSQTVELLEVIVVDDDSDDGTGDIARSMGVKVLQAHSKPGDWTGKTWACHTGAEAAIGDTLLFLDADVRLETEALAFLVKMYGETGRAVSVQPYHRVKRAYEYLSVFFNIIETAVNDAGKLGFYGPVILIGAAEYRAIEGHGSVKESVIEDVALGGRLKADGTGFEVYSGIKQISFRMYPGGLRQLYQGWTKNFAAGAQKTPFPLILASVTWISACISVLPAMILHAAAGNTALAVWHAAFYLLLTAGVIRAARHVGDYRIPGLIIFPVWMAGFLVLFSISLFKKAFGLSVRWKGRKCDS